MSAAAASHEPSHPDEEMGAGGSPASLFTIGWRTLAISASLLAVGLGVALALVVSLDQPDTLSAVALSLAILAFIIQILVFIAQSHGASEQMLQSERLNASTRVLLKSVQSEIHGARAVLAEQFDTVLRHALGIAIPQSVGESEAGIDQNLLEESILQKVRETLSVTGFARPSAIRLEDDALASVEDLSIARELSTAPSESEALRWSEILSRLRPRAIGRLADFGREEEASRRAGRPVGLAPSPAFVAEDEELQRAGLIQEHHAAHNVVYRLTYEGRQAVRLIIGRQSV